MSDAKKEKLQLDNLEVVELEDEALEGVAGGANDSCSGPGPNDGCSGVGPNTGCSGPGGPDIEIQ